MEHAPSIQLDRGGRWRHGAGVPEPRFLAVALAACSPAISAPQQPATSGQHTAPEQAVQAYFAASDQCSSRILRTAFHPATRMQWLDGKTGALRSRAQLS
jgi:hypothetical protein